MLIIILAFFATAAALDMTHGSVISLLHFINTLWQGLFAMKQNSKTSNITDCVTDITF